MESQASHVLVATAGLITNGGKILLIKRGKEPNLGLWSPPGGLVELGETIEESLVREIREETGLKARPVSIAAVSQLIQKDEKIGQPHHYIIVNMTAELIGGTLKAGEDAEAVEWVPLREIHNKKLAKGVEGVLSRIGLVKAG